METEHKDHVEVTHLPDSQPHGGSMSNFPGCPVCEALDRIFRKDKNKKRAWQDKDKVKD